MFRHAIETIAPVEQPGTGSRASASGHSPKPPAFPIPNDHAPATTRTGPAALSWPTGIDRPYPADKGSPRFPISPMKTPVLDAGLFPEHLVILGRRPQSGMEMARPCPARREKPPHRNGPRRFASLIPPIAAVALAPCVTRRVTLLERPQGRARFVRRWTHKVHSPNTRATPKVVGRQATCFVAVGRRTMLDGPGPLDGRHGGSF